MAVAVALKEAEELQCETKLINVREYQLLFCDGKEEESEFLFADLSMRPVFVTSPNEQKGSNPLDRLLPSSLLRRSHELRRSAESFSKSVAM
jgi:hypothetical protein